MDHCRKILCLLLCFSVLNGLWMPASAQEEVWEEIPAGLWGDADDAAMEEPLEEPEEELKIERVKKFYMKSMTREEAILQMNLLEHSFFAFRNEEADGAFAVVYKRNDGGYGLIQDVE